MGKIFRSNRMGKRRPGVAEFLNNLRSFRLEGWLNGLNISEHQDGEEKTRGRRGLDVEHRGRVESNACRA